MTVKYVKGPPLPQQPPMKVVLFGSGHGKLDLSGWKAYAVSNSSKNNHWISIPSDPEFWKSLSLGYTGELSYWDSKNSWYCLPENGTTVNHRVLLPKKARKKLIRMVVTEEFFVSLERSGVPYMPSAFHPIKVKGVKQQLWLFTSNSYSNVKTLTAAVRSAVGMQISKSVVLLPGDASIDVHSQLHDAAPGKHFSTLTEYDAETLPWVPSADIDKWELCSVNVDGRRAQCFLSKEKGTAA
jgi:hypothetical protein